MATRAARNGKKRRRSSGLPILFTVSLLLLLASVGLLVAELISFSQREERLPAGLTVGGITVGGLEPQDAVGRWEQAFASPLTLYYNESPILLSPDAIGFRPSSATMLAAARAAGEAKGGFWARFFSYLLGQEEVLLTNIELQADYQTSLLESFLRDIAIRYDRPPGQPIYDTLTMTTYIGSSGYELDIDAAKIAIDAALRDPIRRSVSLPIRSSDSENPGLDKLQELIITFLDSRGFIYDGQSTVASIFIMDLLTGEEINILGDVAFSSASVAKVPIMIDFYRYLSASPSREEAWLLVNSLLCSNNASSNLIMQIIGGNNLFGGLTSVSNTAGYVGAPNTFITAPFILGVPGQELGSVPAPPTSPNPNFDTRPDPFNQTTAEDMGTLFNMIYDCAQFGSGLITAYPNGEITQQDCRQMLEIMSANDLLRLLQGGIPAGTRISHKNGWVGGVVGDAGIVFPPNGRNYIISVFLWEDREFQDFEVLWPLLEEISRAAWNHFSPETPLLEPRTDLPRTAQECEGNYLPPNPDLVNLNDINAWRR